MSQIFVTCVLSYVVSWQGFVIGLVAQLGYIDQASANTAQSKERVKTQHTPIHTYPTRSCRCRHALRHAAQMPTLSTYTHATPHCLCATPHCLCALRSLPPFSDFLICIEMLLASLAHFYIFPSEQWAPGHREQKERVSIFENLFLRVPAGESKEKKKKVEEEKSG